MGIPKTIRSWLEKNDLYLKARYSPFVLNIWLTLRKDVRKDIAQQYRFYEGLLSSVQKISNTIFDIGANEGFHTQVFIDLGYNVVAVEPSARNIAILKARFNNNNAIKIVAAAASDTNGKLSFYENKKDQALGTISEKRKQAQENMAETLNVTLIDTVSLDDLIEEFDLPQYIKIDVEGYEENVLDGLATKIPIISFEAMIPQFLPECEACINKLIAINNAALFNYTSAVPELQLGEYVSGKELIEIIKNIDECTLNVFCINPGTAAV